MGKEDVAASGESHGGMSYSTFDEGMTFDERQDEVRKSLNISTKEWRWMKFSQKVRDHIRDYVVELYGDWPDEHMEGMNTEQIIGKMSHYFKRLGKVEKVKGEGQQLLDLFKICHYCQYLADKMEGWEYKE